MARKAFVSEDIFVKKDTLLSPDMLSGVNDGGEVSSIEQSLIQHRANHFLSLIRCVQGQNGKFSYVHPITPSRDQSAPIHASKGNAMLNHLQALTT
jgi:hypothetical protein